MSEAWELVDHNTMLGIRRYIGSGEEPDTVLVKTEFDDHGTSKLLDQNKALQNEDFDRRSDMWHAAQIPARVMYEWLTKFGVNAWNPQHMPAVKKLLNSSEYRWCMVKNIIL